MRWELGEAARQRKRLIPVRIRPLATGQLPEELGRIHILPADGLYEHLEHFPQLERALLENRQWVREATRLSDRARQWTARGRDSSLLLRGAALKDAERWAAKPPDLPPAEAMELIYASKQYSTSNQKRVIAASLFVALAAITVATFAVIKRNEALLSQSEFLSKIADEQIAEGNSGNGLAVALEGLPQWESGFDRPTSISNVRSLHRALLTLHEKATLQGHTADVNQILTSPNGQVIATTSDDGLLKLWDRNTHKLLRTLDGHNRKRVYKFVFSADSATMYSASQDGNVIVWSVADGAIIEKSSASSAGVRAILLDDRRNVVVSASDNSDLVFASAGGVELYRAKTQHQGRINAVALSPNGKWLVTAGHDGNITVWDPANRNELIKLPPHKTAAIGASFDSDSTLLATHSHDGSVTIWDTVTWKAMGSLSGHTQSVRSAVFSPDGSLILTASADGTVRLWSTTTLLEQHVFPPYSKGVWKAIFSPNGKFVAVATQEGTIDVWNTATKTRFLRLAGHSGDVVDVSFADDGLLLSASKDKTARVWDLTRTPTAKLVHLHPRQAVSVACGYDGRICASAFEDKTVKVWSDRVPEGGWDRQLDDEISRIKIAARSPLMAIGHLSGAVSVLDLGHVAGKIRTLEGATKTIFDLDFSPDARRIAAASSGGLVSIWNINDGQVLFTLPKTEIVTSLAFAEDGKRLVTAAWNGTIRLWDLESREQLREFTPVGPRVPVRSIVWHGNDIISASDDGVIRTHSMSKEISREIRVESGQAITQIAINPNSQLVAAASVNGWIRIWELQSQRVVVDLRRNHARVSGIAFRIGGQDVWSSSDDGSVVTLSINSRLGEVVSVARSVAPRCLDNLERTKFGLASTVSSWCSTDKR